MRLTAREPARTVQSPCIVAPDVDKQLLENTMLAMERCCILSASTRTVVQDVERESPLHLWLLSIDIGTLNVSTVQIAAQNSAPASTTRTINHTVAIVLDNEEEVEL
jgi:predicted P-loop ATPase/GTPase